ncbi:hypothetical protein PLICRDRAFT_43564 [Plicaturopsis crispa FD-325 SS-3]|nr:hypothetical protein PLICRDRAFT_43564 [Plicaturopsis crispa FD-325 SS-3]
MPSPFSLTVAPSSPLLRPPGEPVSADAPQPPLLRPSSYRPEPPRASDETVAKIRKLRRSDPAYYTCKKLATMFNCTEHFVSRIASLPKPLRKKVVKQTLLEHEKVREGWGEKKFMARAIRQKRREFW